MQIKPFPLCCGAFVLTNFGGTSCTNGKSRPDDIEELEGELKDTVKRYGAVSFLMAILNEEQVSKFHDILLKHGFEPTKQGYNSNHDSVLELYVRANSED